MRTGEINRERSGSDAKLAAQFVGEMLKLNGVACYQDDVVVIFGEQFGEFIADAARGARDQGSAHRHNSMPSGFQGSSSPATFGHEYGGSVDPPYEKSGSLCANHGRFHTVHRVPGTGGLQSIVDIVDVLDALSL